MQFTIAPEIFERFPGIRIAGAVARGVDNGRANPPVEARWREEWARVVEAATYGNAQSHPRVAPWRGRFAALGISGKQFPSSIEAMLRRALKGGEPFTINPLVDFYNAVSLRHTVPAGGFDLADVHGPLELRLSRAGDEFMALDTDVAILVPPGEISYADGQVILTRHFVWRQARTALITPATRDLILVSEVLAEVGRETAEAVRAEFYDGLCEYFGVTAEAFLLDAEQRAVAW
jgi:DNA/RNA-binding domain of Phe-tRNA-synthetase-like protein